MTPVWPTFLYATVLTRMLIMGLLCWGPASSVGTLYFESRSVTVYRQTDVLSVMGAESPTQARSEPTESCGISECRTAAFRSPAVTMRLQALEAWAQQDPDGSDDVLRRALDDPDERVRARALQLIEEDWMREVAELNKRH